MVVSAPMFSEVNGGQTTLVIQERTFSRASGAEAPSAVCEFTVPCNLQCGQSLWIPAAKQGIFEADFGTSQKQTCVRPVCAAHAAAGSDGFRKPNPQTLVMNEGAKGGRSMLM